MTTAYPSRFFAPPAQTVERARSELQAELAEMIEATAYSLLDPERLLAIAEDLRLVSRQRTYHSGWVVVSLVLSAMQRSTDTAGRLLDARRTYETLTGTATQESGFRKKARQLVPVLHELLRRHMKSLADAADAPELRGRLTGLRDILVPDGCAFKLANTLAGLYEGTGQPAELKLHAVYSVRTGGVVSMERTAGSVHDSAGFNPQWEAGALYIWDLGYNDYDRVIAAIRGAAFVLQRLKSGANPVVIASYSKDGVRREIRDEDGRRVRLEAACACGLVHHDRILDLDVELSDETGTVVVRVVCVPFGGEDRYYLTSLPRALFTPHDIAELYRMRWEIELFFRGLKGGLRLDEVRRLAHPDSLDVIVSASLLGAVLARDLTTRLNALSAAESASPEAFPPGAAGVHLRDARRVSLRPS